MTEKEINLKLKQFGCFRRTGTGAFLYTEHGFRIFVPKKILKMCLENVAFPK